MRDSTVARSVPLAVATLFVVGFFLSVYPLGGHEQPLGFDTARYLWRNACVAEGGLDGLAGCRPPLSSSLPGRPGYPLMTLPLAAAVSGSDPFPVAAALPAVLAAAVGLAAGALVTSTVGGGPVTAGVVGAVTGTSGMLVRLAGPEGYADNLIALTVGVGGLVGAAAFARGGRGATLGGGLLGIAGIVHWPTFLVLVGTVGLASLLAVPSAIAGSRDGVALRDTGAVRLGIVAAIGAAVWAGGTWVVLGTAPQRFGADPGSLRNKVRSDIVAYLVPVTGGAAAVGAVAVARRRARGEGRRVLEWILMAWLGVTALAIVVFLAEPDLPGLGPGFPLHRVLALALPVPILGSLAILWAREAAGRRSRVAGAAVAVLGVAALAPIGFRQWARVDAFLDTARLRDASVAAAYLEETVPPRTPAIVVVDGVGENPFTELFEVADTIRVPLPPHRVATTALYLGHPDRLLEGVPTFTGTNPAYDAASRQRWSVVERMLSRRNVVLALRSSTPAFPELAREAPERVVGPGALVVRGPPPVSRHRPDERFAPLGLGETATGAAGSLVLLALAGVGWARVLLGPQIRPFEVLAVSPAVGLGILIAGGLAADALGIRLGGVAGVAILLGTAALGLWTAAAVRERSARMLP